MRLLSRFGFQCVDLRHYDTGSANLIIVACADKAWDDKDPATDYKVWSDW